MLKTPHSFLEYTWFIIIFLYSWIQFAGICLTFLYLYSWERSICNFLAVILCGFNTNFLVYLKFLKISVKIECVSSSYIIISSLNKVNFSRNIFSYSRKVMNLIMWQRWLKVSVVVMIMMLIVTNTYLVCATCQAVL